MFVLTEITTITITVLLKSEITKFLTIILMQTSPWRSGYYNWKIDRDTYRETSSSKTKTSLPLVTYPSTLHRRKFIHRIQFTPGVAWPLTGNKRALLWVTFAFVSFFLYPEIFGFFRTSFSGRFGPISIWEFCITTFGWINHLLMIVDLGCIFGVLYWKG